MWLCSLFSACLDSLAPEPQTQNRLGVSGFRVQGLGFGVQGSGFRVWGSGVWGLGFRV